MNNLTAKDLIDYTNFVETTSNSMEQQIFILSRFFELPIEHIHKIGMDMFLVMNKELNEYLDAMNIQLNKKSLIEVGKIEEPINNRFEILDI